MSEPGRVFARMRFSGRHVGEFLGFAPTDALVAWEGAARFRIEGGRIADVWVLGDLDGLKARLECQARAAGRRSVNDGAGARRR